MSNILVTGGAGYIGSHVCKALAMVGYTPVAYDNLVYGHEWAVKWGPLERGDVIERSRLNEVFRRYRPAAVMHFAAYTSVGESVEDPGKYYSNNLFGSLTLLDAMRDNGVNELVFSSTCATYGVPEKIPISEDHPQHPINPYGASKLMVERVLADFRQAHGLRSIALRYFNAAGADPEGEIGEDRNPETKLIPLVLDTAAGIRPNVTVYGADYPTPDGTCIRDFVHVTDLADAHVAALRKLEAGGGRHCYNLGTGSGVSVFELIEASRRITGRRIDDAVGHRRPGDPPELVADARSACAELGWRPRLSAVNDIVHTAWSWHRTKASRTEDAPASRRKVARDERDD
jgi:UDP-arabinose 4-epimerase